MPRASSLLVLLVVLLLASPPGRADTLHLKSGGKFEGELVEETATHYVFKIPGLGTQRFRKVDVLRIEKGESAYAEYERRLKEIEDGDAEAHYRLGIWCAAAGLVKEARKEFRAAIVIQPDHAGARMKLGHRLVDGKWVDPAAARRAKAERTRREAEAEQKVELYFLNHSLSENFALPGEAWFWPPREWKVEEAPGGAKFTGPILRDIHPTLAVRVVADEAEELRKQIGRDVAGGGEAEKLDAPGPIRVGLREAQVLCHRIAGEGIPVSRFDVILDRGTDRIHVRLDGPDAEASRLFSLVSDLCDSFSFEAPPGLGKKLIAYDPPNKDWQRGAGVVGRGSGRRGLGYGETIRQVGHRKRYAQIEVHVTAMPGTSRRTLRDASSFMFRDNDTCKADWGRSWDRKVAGRETLCVPVRFGIKDMKVSDGFFCFFAKGDKTFTVTATDFPFDGLGVAELRRALEQFLDTIRID